MQILSKIAGIGLAASVAFLGTANTAQALDFSFSFDDTVGDNQGEVSGTIFGLNDNETGQEPTSITVDNAPASIGIPSYPVSFGSVDYRPSSTGFDVSGGAITGGQVLFASVDESIRFNFSNAKLTDSNRFANRRVDASIDFSENTGGFSGVTYTATSTPTPVPFGAAPNTGIIILSGMYGASRLRKKFAASK